MFGPHVNVPVDNVPDVLDRRPGLRFCSVRRSDLSAHDRPVTRRRFCRRTAAELGSTVLSMLLFRHTFTTRV